MKLYHGDCLEILPTLADGCVDMVCADPPYGTTACKWDSIIPIDAMWAQLKRVIKLRGAIVMTASQPFTTTLIGSCREWFKYCLVWEKNRSTNFYNSKHQPGKSHEDVAVFSKAASSHSPLLTMTYNPQKEQGDAWKRRDVSSGRHTFHQAKRPMERVSDGGRFPRSVLRFPCEFDFHPTQKPVALMEYLIRTYTNEGETVLDFCMGSGTTGVACVQTGRDFIGVEKDKGYFEIAEKRIEEARRKTAEEVLFV